MKLHEITNRKRRLPTERVSVEPGGGVYGEFKVDVAYDYEPGGSTQHEPDNSSFREYHDADLTIDSITLAQDVHEYDQDGEKTSKVWKKGTDATKLPGWDKTDDDYVYNVVFDIVDGNAKDYDPD